MDATYSYITIKNSTAIKGLLIFLIVLGHNMIFTYYLEPFQGMGYLYCFHIQSFFILPFLYGSKPLSKNRIVNYFIRLYWPYIILTILMSVGYYTIYLKNGFDFKGVLRMCVTGDVNLIKQYCGIQIFWFMPAMFSLFVLKDYYYYSSRIAKSILLLLSCSANVFLFLAMYNGYYYKISSNIQSYLPFGIYMGVSYLIFGVSVRWIIFRLLTKNRNISIYLMILFFICSIIYFLNVRLMHLYTVLILLKIIMPVVFMLILWYYSNYFVKNRIWEKLGDKTFPIYLLHPFIGYVLYWVVSEYFQISLFWAIITQIVMLSVSYYLSVGLYRMNRLRMLLLPRSFSDIKSSFN